MNFNLDRYIVGFVTAFLFFAIILQSVVGALLMAALMIGGVFLEVSYNGIKPVETASKRQIKLRKSANLPLFYRNFLVLAAAVIRADKKILVVEQKAVLRFIEKEYPALSAKRYNQTLQKLLRQNTINYKTAALKLSGFAHRDKVLVLFMLLKIAVTDTKYSTDEENIIYEIARFLNISESNFKKLRAMVVDDQINEPIKQAKAREAEKQHQQNKYQHQQQTIENTNLAYQILGLNPNATKAEIKKAYRKMVKQHHPDKVAYLGEPAKSEANAMFLKIQKAYEQLENKKEYFMKNT